MCVFDIANVVYFLVVKVYKQIFNRKLRTVVAEKKIFLKKKT
jgi:hypothetical protein